MSKRKSNELEEENSEQKAVSRGKIPRKDAKAQRKGKLGDFAALAERA